MNFLRKLKVFFFGPMSVFKKTKTSVWYGPNKADYYEKIMTLCDREFVLSPIKDWKKSYKGDVHLVEKRTPHTCVVWRYSNKLGWVSEAIDTGPDFSNLDFSPDDY